MALLQITSPKGNIQLAEATAKIYSATLNQNLESFKIACLEQLAGLLPVEQLYWRAETEDCLGGSVEAANYVYQNQCKKTGFHHQLSASITNNKSGLGYSTAEVLDLLLPHLLSAYSLYQFNAVRLACSQLCYDHGLYDCTGSAVQATPMYENILSRGRVASGENEFFPSELPQGTVVQAGENLFLASALFGFVLVEAVSLPSSFSVLSDKEKQLCFYLGKALPNKKIAGYLGSSEKTVENQLTNIYRKLKLRSRTMLIRELKAGLCERA